MNITPIVVWLITMLFAVLTYYIARLLKSKQEVEDNKVREYQADLLKIAIKTAVSSAEQLYNSDEGRKKKSYVIGLLQSQGYEIDTAAVDAAIEAAVLELHRKLE